MNPKQFLSFILTFLALSGLAEAEAIYNEKADPQHEVSAAIAEASRSGKNIVLIFGANW